MPIFHDPQDSLSWRPVVRQTSAEHAMEDTTDLACDVPSLGSLSMQSVLDSNAVLGPTGHESRPTSQDRNGLIERIKRVKSPLWQFRQDVSDDFVL